MTRDRCGNLSAICRRWEGGVASISDAERRVLLSNPWFAGLPEASFDAFVASAQRKVLKEGERLYSRGDDPSDGI